MTRSNFQISGSKRNMWDTGGDLEEDAMAYGKFQDRWRKALCDFDDCVDNSIF